MPAPSEHQIHRAFHWWFAGKPPQIIAARRPGVVSWHTPNGGKRDSFEAKRFTELGVLAGIPDYFMLYGGTLFALEFKDDEGRLSRAQLDLHPRLIAAGAKVATVDNLADAKRQAISWGLVDSQHTL